MKNKILHLIIVITFFIQSMNPLFSDDKACSISLEDLNISENNESILDLNYMSKCRDQLFDNSDSSHISKTYNFYLWVNHYLRAENLGEKGSFEAFEAMLRYETLLMAQENMCQNGHQSIKEFEIPNCNDAFSDFSNLTTGAGQEYVKCNNPYPDKVLEEILSDPKSDDRRQLIQELKKIQLDLYIAKKSLEKLRPDSPIGYSSAEKVSAEIFKKQYVNIRSVLSKLKAIDPRLLVGADHNNLNFPVLDVITAYLISQEEKDTRLNYDSLKGKMVPLSRARIHKKMSSMLRYNNSLLYQTEDEEEIRPLLQKNIDEYQKQFSNSVNVLGRKGVLIKTDSEMEYRKKACDFLETSEVHDFKNKYQKYLKECIENKTRAIRSSAKCNFEVSKKLEEELPDSLKDDLVYNSAICENKDLDQFSQSSWGIPFDRIYKIANKKKEDRYNFLSDANVNDFKKLEQDPFQMLKTGFSPKHFMENLQVAARNESIESMNLICDKSKTPADFLVNSGALQRVVKKFPGLTDKLKCFSQRVKEDKEEKEKFQAISSLACMTVGVGAGVGSMFFSGGTTSSAALTIGSSTNLACEAFFGFQTYQSFVDSSNEVEIQEKCKMLPLFINNPVCDEKISLETRADAAAARFDLVLDTALSPLTLLGIVSDSADLVRGLKKISRKSSLLKKYKRSSDEAYLRAKKSGKSDVVAQDLAQQAYRKEVAKELVKTDEFQGYPDWFINELLSCKM